MSKDNIYYANDSTRFSSIIERNHYNQKLKEKEEDKKYKKNNFIFYYFYKNYTNQSLTFY